jgi:uncharacterized cupredoxin-like copper-binding protein
MSPPRARHKPFLIAAIAALAIAVSSLPAAADESAHHLQGMASHGHERQFLFGEPGNHKAVSRTVAITMNDMSFDPTSIAVAAGETIRFVIVNKSGIDHDFTLGDEATQVPHRAEMAQMMESGAAMHHGDPNAVAVGAGQTTTLLWHFTRPGKDEFACNIPDHYEAGMKGEILVAPKG